MGPTPELFFLVGAWPGAPVVLEHQSLCIWWNTFKMIFPSDKLSGIYQILPSFQLPIKNEFMISFIKDNVSFNLFNYNWWFYKSDSRIEYWILDWNMMVGISLRTSKMPKLSDTVEILSRLSSFKFLPVIWDVLQHYQFIVLIPNMGFFGNF